MIRAALLAIALAAGCGPRASTAAGGARTRQAEAPAAVATTAPPPHRPDPGFVSLIYPLMEEDEELVVQDLGVTDAQPVGAPYGSTEIEMSGYRFYRTGTEPAAALRLTLIGPSESCVDRPRTWMTMIAAPPPDGSPAPAHRVRAAVVSPCMEGALLAIAQATEAPSPIVHPVAEGATQAGSFTLRPVTEGEIPMLAVERGDERLATLDDMAILLSLVEVGHQTYLIVEYPAVTTVFEATPSGLRPLSLGE